MCTKEIKDNPPGFRHPSEHNLQHKEIKIKTKDNLTLYGWFIFKERNPNLPTFIYFHENAGNIGFRLHFSRYLVEKIKSNVLVIGYRGYGYSEGEPTEQGIMLDAEAILNYVYDEKSELIDYIDVNNLYIFGRSLGGAVAMYICDKLKPKIKGLVLENTFTSMPDMVDQIFPFLKHVKNILLTNHWPSKDRIKNLEYPIYFISSERDELVPFAHMEELFTLATKAAFKNKFIIKGGTHNESWQRCQHDYEQKLKEFLEKCSNKEDNMEDIEDELNNAINYGSSINREEDSYLLGKKDI